MAERFETATGDLARRVVGEVDAAVAAAKPVLALEGLAERPVAGLDAASDRILSVASRLDD